jgi:hypothetical protein
MRHAMRLHHKCGQAFIVHEPTKYTAPPVYIALGGAGVVLQCPRCGEVLPDAMPQHSIYPAIARGVDWYQRERDDEEGDSDRL